MTQQPLGSDGLVDELADPPINYTLAQLWGLCRRAAACIEAAEARAQKLEAELAVTRRERDRSVAFHESASAQAYDAEAQLAQALAREGEREWRHFRGTRLNAIMIAGDKEIVHWSGFDASHIKSHAKRSRNAAHIATSNPAAVSDLCAYVLWLEKEVAGLPKIREALATAEDWFRDYDRQHRAKCSAEGDAKAEVNRRRADFLAAALHQETSTASPAHASDEAPCPHRGSILHGVS